MPEEQRIAPGLTVLENIRLGILASPRRRQEKQVIEGIADTFPRLKERLLQQAITMSDEEQQMLTATRAVTATPKWSCWTTIMPPGRRSRMRAPR